MILAAAILQLYPDARPGVDFRCVHDAEGQRVAEWSLPDPQPTQEQLEAAWVAVQVAQAARDAFWQARLAMAEKYYNLPVAIRNRYRGVYNDINLALQRGDAELAYYSLVNMNVQAGDEQLHAEFLALFPS